MNAFLATLLFGAAEEGRLKREFRFIERPFSECICARCSYGLSHGRCCLDFILIFLAWLFCIWDFG